MKKKVVAMVTLAMFVLSMVPMAAFAAVGNANPDKSTVQTVEENATAVVGDYTKVKVNANNTAGSPVSADNKVLVWFEKEGAPGVATTSVAYSTDGSSDTTDKVEAYKEGYAYAGTEVYAKFTEAGTYTVKAVMSLSQNGTDYVALKGVKDFGTVTVTDKTYEVESVKAENVAVFENHQVNGIETKTVNVTVTGKTESVPVGTELTVTNNYVNKGIKVNGSDEKNVVIKTTATGASKTATASFTVTASNKLADGTFKLGLECNGVDGIAEVVVKPATPDVVAQTITAVKVENAIAMPANGKPSLATVKFELRDANGNAVLVDNEPVVSGVKVPGLSSDNYVKVEKKPKDSTLESKNIRLIPAEDGSTTMQLNTTGTVTVGDYTISIGLQNGQWATTSFTVANFDEKNIEKMVVVPADGNTDIVAKAAGQEATENYRVVYVDKNGIEKSVKEVDGKAPIVSIDPIRNGLQVDNTTFGQLKVKYEDPVKKEDILGTKISLLAVNAAGDMVATENFTVVETPATSNEYKLVFADENNDLKGDALKNNVVTAKVVNVDDSKKTLNIKKLYVKADKESPVQVESNGKTAITLYSDKDATVDVQVTAVATNTDTNTEETYHGTFSYTIGSDVIPADTSVVMTFGSSKMIINNEVVDMKDAAPFVQDNRTFVPFRALGEALGASVNYVAADNTVTYTLGNTEIVMTLNSKDYTVNGAKKTMDVAPFAKDNRTYVPVRFVGEALGFNVTALQTGAGEYVGVAFTK